MKKYNGVYLVGNYPSKERFVDAAVKAMEFFDFIEIGIPFSDPVADGPVIASASHEMLVKGETLSSILESVDEIKNKISDEKDIYLMTYANHIFYRGIENFAKICQKHGIDGLIIPDIPFAERERFTVILNQYNISLVPFITPETTESQALKAASQNSGFIYSVSLRGVTGSKMKLDSQTMNIINYTKENSKVPVVLGFGIRDEESCRNALSNADGFIIGTKMIELLGKDGNEEFYSFIDSLKKIRE